MTTMNNEDPDHGKPSGLWACAECGRKFEPADQMREAIAAERERSHELLQAADHIRAGLEAKLAALSAALAEKEQPQMTPATKRPPRRADLARLAKLLDKWQRDEDRMVSEGVEFVSGSIRSVRLRDMAALRDVLAYFDQS